MPRVKYHLNGQTFRHNFEGCTFILPTGATHIYIVSEKEEAVFDLELPQPQKAKAQYQAMNHWKNKRKR